MHLQHLLPVRRPAEGVHPGQAELLPLPQLPAGPHLPRPRLQAVAEHCVGAAAVVNPIEEKLYSLFSSPDGDVML